MIAKAVLTVLFLTLVLILILALTARLTLFARQRYRRMYWRTRFYLCPGPGFASPAEIQFRWSRLAAVFHGGRARPSLPFARRIFTPARHYAVRLGRTTFGRRAFSRAEEQTLILAPPRTGKTGFLGDWLISHTGPVLAASSRADLFHATAGYRARLGPVEVFNPLGVSGIPSTFRWDICAGCEDPAEALLRAEGLVGAVTTGEMAWWSEKSIAALAAVMHAARMLGGDMADVGAWADGRLPGLIADARAVPGASMELLGALAELERGGKTADSIRLTMSKSIHWLAVPAIRAMVSGPGATPFDVERFIMDNGTVYMISGGATDPSAPLFRCFTSYLHRRAGLLGSAMSHRRLDPSLLLAIDELHACPVDLPSWMADSAGKGIQVVAVVHSTGQLRKAYDDDGFITVWDTAACKLLLPGNHNADTLEDVARLCGRIMADDERDVVPPQYLAQLPDMHALVLRLNCRPLVVKLRPYWHRLGFRLGRIPALPALRPLPMPGPRAVPEMITPEDDAAA